MYNDKNSRPRYGTQLGCALVVIVLFAFIQPVRAQFAEFHQTLSVTSAEPLTIDVDISNGDLQILYSRDGEVSITGMAQNTGVARLDDGYFKAVLKIELNGNHLTVSHTPNPAYPEPGVGVSYRLDVPYRTQVTSRVDHGNQTISGIMGPVVAVTRKGEIKASYISKGLKATADIGNLDIQVIGEHVEAKTGTGKISCERLPQGVEAEAGNGDITLMVVGPSVAVVRQGSGRIEVGGARDSLVASTNGGDLSVKAIPHSDWRLQSVSGNIHLELPPVAKFDLDAEADSGTLQVDREGMAMLDSTTRDFHQKSNGGGTRIAVHTVSGIISIQ